MNDLEGEDRRWSFFQSVPRKLGTLASLTGDQRLLLAEAAVWLAVARVALVIFPFRKVAKHLGQVSALQARTQIRPAEERLAQQVGWAVRRMADNVPFKAVCLQQGVAAKAMLRRRGIASALHLGVMRSEEKPLEAHAWLDAGDAGVTGYPVRGYTEIACFI